MEEKLGMIKLFAGSFVPENYLECNGQMLGVQSYLALFSLLGTTYGGNGQTNFGLPNLTAPDENLKYIICVQGLYPIRP